MRIGVRPAIKVYKTAMLLRDWQYVQREGVGEVLLDADEENPARVLRTSDVIAGLELELTEKLPTDKEFADVDAEMHAMDEKQPGLTDIQGIDWNFLRRRR